LIFLGKIINMDKRSLFAHGPALVESRPWRGVAGKQGFSLLEVFVIVGALVILGALIFLLLGKTDFLAELRDSQRISDLNRFRADLNSYLSANPNVNICDRTSGDNFPKFPVDPINDGEYKYSYACDKTLKTFEINAKMESARYAQGGSDDMESTDGGNQPDVYEAGNASGLSL